MLNIMIIKSLALTIPENVTNILDKENQKGAKGRIALEAYSYDGNLVPFNQIEPTDSVVVVYQFLENEEVDDSLDITTFTGDLVMATETAYRIHKELQREYPNIQLSLDNAEGGTLLPRVGQSVKLITIIDNDETAYSEAFISSIPHGIEEAKGLLSKGIDCIRFDYKQLDGYTVTCDVWNKG